MGKPKYMEGAEIELADIQAVEDVLQRKIAYIKETEPYAFYTIQEMETTLSVLSDLYSDLDD